MKTYIAGIAIVIVTLLAVVTGAHASTVPTPTATQVAPLTVVLDASTSPCESSCSYEWRGFSSTSNRLGFTVGYGETLTYKVGTPGTYSFVVKKIVRCSAGSTRTCPSTNTVYVTITG